MKKPSSFEDGFLWPALELEPVTPAMRRTMLARCLAVGDHGDSQGEGRGFLHHASCYELLSENEPLVIRAAAGAGGRGVRGKEEQWG